MGTRNKKHAVALTDMGFAIMQKNDLNKARLFFTQALEIDPDNASAILNLGVLSEKEGNTGQAIREYRRVLAIQPAEEGKETGDGKGAGEENLHLQRVKDLAAQNLQRLGFEDERSGHSPRQQEQQAYIHL